MIASYFEKEIRNFLNENDCEIRKYIKYEYLKSKINNYYSFFDIFLYSYGVLSINIYHGEKNKYFPYIKFDNNNIFNEEEGFLELSIRPVGSKTAEKLMANYLISKIVFLQEDRFKNWKKEYSC